MGIEPDTKSNDPELLKRVMEFWEELDEVESEEELEVLSFKIQSVIQETVQKISKGFKDKDYRTLVNLTVELKYWYSLRDQILNKEFR